MPGWETALLPWDLLCTLGRIAWEGDKIYTLDYYTESAHWADLVKKGVTNVKYV